MTHRTFCAQMSRTAQLPAARHQPGLAVRDTSVNLVSRTETEAECLARSYNKSAWYRHAELHQVDGCDTVDAYPCIAGGWEAVAVRWAKNAHLFLAASAVYMTEVNTYCEFA